MLVAGHRLVQIEEMREGGGAQRDELLATGDGGWRFESVA
jgi:hypothetical protein